MTTTDPYRGPRVIARGGRGMGASVWVVPGIPGYSDEELKRMGESMTSAWYDSKQKEVEAEDEMEAMLVDAFEAAVTADHRPGYGDYYFDPDNDGEVDEFADVEIGGPGPQAGKVSAEPIGPAETVVVKVLGPVEVEGWQSPPKRKIISELACYLSLHAGRPVSGEELRAALWPDADSEASSKSLRNYMSELRRSLGSEHVPLARGTGYAVAPTVVSDWAQFNELVKSTQLIGSDEAGILKDALSLVRGRPFTGVTYNWAFAELLVSQMEVGVSEAATRLAEISMATGDPATAAFAARQGLLVTPFDVTLWEIALRAATALGRSEVVRTWRDAKATLGGDATELSDLRRTLESD